MTAGSGWDIVALLKSFEDKIQSLWKSSNSFRFFTIAMSYSFSYVIYRKYYRRYYSIPPGPCGIPLFGSLLSLGLWPRQFMISNCKYGGLSSFYLGHTLIISANNGNIGHKILKKAGNAAINRPWNNVIESLPIVYFPNSSGPQWYKRRRLGQTNFISIAKSEFMLKTMQHAINKCIVPEIDTCISQDKLFYPHKYMFYLGFNSVYSIMFGGHVDIKNPIVTRWLDNIAKMFIGMMPLLILQLYNINFIPPDLYWKFSNFKKSVKIIEDDIEQYMINYAGFELNKENLWQRSKLRTDDIDVFIDAAISYQHKEEWYDKQMLLNDVSVYFLSGSDSTGASAEYGLLLLAKYPDVQQAIYDELINILNKNNVQQFTFSIIHQLYKLKAFVHETIRISTVSPLGLFHVLEQDIEYDKFILPKNSFFILNHIAINKYSWNDTTYSDNEMKLENWLDENGKFTMNPQFITFGSGKRDCMGRPIAMKNLYAIFATLIMKYKFINPNSDKLMDIQQKWGALRIINPEKGLKVVKR
eukprot:479634_1